VGGTFAEGFGAVGRADWQEQEQEQAQASRQQQVAARKSKGSDLLPPKRKIFADINW